MFLINGNNKALQGLQEAWMASRDLDPFQVNLKNILHHLNHDCYFYTLTQRTVH